MTASSCSQLTITKLILCNVILIHSELFLVFLYKWKVQTQPKSYRYKLFFRQGAA